jgi:hypothetical protein
LGASHSVVPRVSVGDKKIEMTRESIYHVLGAPNSSRTGAENLSNSSLSDLNLNKTKFPGLEASFALDAIKSP